MGGVSSILKNNSHISNEINIIFADIGYIHGNKAIKNTRNTPKESKVISKSTRNIKKFLCGRRQENRKNKIQKFIFGRIFLLFSEIDINILKYQFYNNIIKLNKEVSMTNSAS